MANARKPGLNERLMEEYVVEGGGELSEVILKKLGVVNANVKPLFAMRKLTWLTTLLIVFWGQSFIYMRTILWHMEYITDPHISAALIGLVFLLY